MQSIEYPTLLEFPAPLLRVHPRVTVIAEKYQVLLNLVMTNSRMKDFYDIWVKPLYYLKIFKNFLPFDLLLNIDFNYFLLIAIW